MVLRYRIVAALSFGLAGISIAAQPATEKKEQAKPAASAPVPAPRHVRIHGIVFEDTNANGQRDTGEAALPDMAASDGVGWRKTATDGTFEFTCDEDVTGAVFVCTPAGWRASKQFYIIADFDGHDGRVQEGSIGLVKDETRNADTFDFVQLTDTHVTESADTLATMTDDLNVVNRVTATPAFIVATGDLTNVGTKPEHFTNYVNAVKAARFPYYSVIGNHDYGGQLCKTANYEHFLGPRYYSFTVGRYHFIARDSMMASVDTKSVARQEAWLAEDIRLNAGGRRVIVFQHFLPSNEELDYMSTFNTAAVFSGHWHGRRERMYKNILDVNSATFRFGGIDRSSRGFRTIHVDGDRITCEWRAGQQERRAEVVCPAASTEVVGSTLRLQVLAYDTAVLARSVHYRLMLDGAAKATEGDLSPAGRWMWNGACAIPPDSKARAAQLSVDVTAADGSHWQAASEFTLTHGTDPAPKMGEPWRFFHGDAGHRGFVESGPKPPLNVAWSTNVDGTILLASPVIADGKVYIGTGYRESLDDCAVHALDLASGKQLWRAPVDSSIQHSLAVWNDNILAVSQAATLYCFDATGKQRWDASLAREDSQRWELSFPVTDGKAVYAGRCNGFGAYSLTDGKPLWRQPGGRDWWPNVYSGPSLGTNRVYQGGPFVRALNPATGDILWNNADTVVSTVAVVPAVVERDGNTDRLYVFNNGKTLLCLNGATGKTIWKASRGTPPTASAPAPEVQLGNETGTPAVGENVVCVGGGEVNWPGQPQASAAMHGIDKQTGKLLWRQSVGKGLVSSIPYHRMEATITSSPVIVGDVVWFGANDGVLYALDVNTGEPIWTYRLGVPIASTVAVSGNTIVVATWDGTVYAFTSAL